MPQSNALLGERLGRATCQGCNHFSMLCLKNQPEKGLEKRKKDCVAGSKGWNNKGTVKKNVHEEQSHINGQAGANSSSSEDTTCEYEFFVDSVQVNNSGSVCAAGLVGDRNRQRKETMWTKNVLVNNIPVVFKLDTGVEVSTLPASFLTKISPKVKVNKTPITLVLYGNNTSKIKCV